MPPRAAKSAARPKSAGATPDDVPVPKKQVTFESRTDISDDLFVAILCRIVDDNRLAASIFPAPVDGYSRNSWLERVSSGPVEKALRTVAAEAQQEGADENSELLAKRLVEELFANGMTEHRSRGNPEEDEFKALDGRAIAALLITHFLANHSASVASLRARMPALAADERRALWDALDSKEERWASRAHATRANPAPPRELWPLQHHMHTVFVQKPGPVQPQVLSDMAWAVHESLRGRQVGELASEMCADVYTISVWAKDDIGPDHPLPQESEQSLLDTIVAVTPRASQKTEFTFEEAPVRMVFEEPPPVKHEALAAVPSWAPAMSIAPQQTVIFGAHDLFEQELRAACMQTETRRRQAI